MKEKRLASIYKGNGSPIVAKKIGRNEKCKCGSGKKAKSCCGTQTGYFDSHKSKHNFKGVKQV